MGELAQGAEDQDLQSEEHGDQEGGLEGGRVRHAGQARDQVGQAAQQAQAEQGRSQAGQALEGRATEGDGKVEREADQGEVGVGALALGARAALDLHLAHVAREGGHQGLEEAATLAALRDPRVDRAIDGGSKVSTKIELLGNLVGKVDALVIGGGMANTFLAAQGKEIGTSLAEMDMLDLAREISTKADAAGCRILLPSDVVVAREFKAHADNETVSADACPKDAMILDAGTDTVAEISKAMAEARTLIWNGPLGAFEMEPFDRATVSAAQTAAALSKSGSLISVAGGGDTVAALNTAGVADDFTYISTAGGAFLEWMEGKTLPGVAALEG